MSFELVPMEDAVKRKNGLGRETPNNFPVLDPPTGRFKFNLFDPLGMFKTIFGPEMANKCLCCCCVIVLIALACVLVYQFATAGMLKAVGL